MKNFAKLSKLKNIWKCIVVTHAHMLFPVLILMFHSNKTSRNHLNTKDSFFSCLNRCFTFLDEILKEQHIKNIYVRMTKGSGFGDQSLSSTLYNGWILPSLFY